jgi:hypothetical protein
MKSSSKPNQKRFDQLLQAMVTQPVPSGKPAISLARPRFGGNFFARFTPLQPFDNLVVNAKSSLTQGAHRGLRKSGFCRSYFFLPS